MENTFYIKDLFHWHRLQDKPILIVPDGWDFLREAAANMRTDWAKHPHNDYTATLIMGQGIGKELTVLQAYGRLIKTTKL